MTSPVIPQINLYSPVSSYSDGLISCLLMSVWAEPVLRKHATSRELLSASKITALVQNDLKILLTAFKSLDIRQNSHSGLTTKYFPVNHLTLFHVFFYEQNTDQ